MGMPRAGSLSLHLPLPPHRELLWLVVLICDVTASSAPKTTVVGSQTGLSALIVSHCYTVIFSVYEVFHVCPRSLAVFVCLLLVGIVPFARSVL